jgi:raffinose/stachyose/melibiose transport system permease protein
MKENVGIINVDAKKGVKKSKIIGIAVIAVIGLLLLLYTVSLLLPIFWGVITSLKTRGDFVENALGLPTVWKFSNYADIYKNFLVITPSRTAVGFWGMLGNSLLYAVISAFLGALSPFLAAYAVAKFRFKFGKIVYGIVIVVMVVPIVGALPSEIRMLHAIGLYDSFFGAWLMKAYFTGIYFLVFHAAFVNIPKEFSEAAEIDGAGRIFVLIRIVLPLVRNVFMTVLLIKFIEFWNDYQMPMLYMPSHPTLAFGAYRMQFNTETIMSSVPMQIGSCMLVLIPILVLYLIFHNRLIGNVTMGGVKE